MASEDFFKDVDFTHIPFTEEHRNIIVYNCKRYFGTYNSKNGELSLLDSSIRRSRFKEYIKNKMKNEIITTDDYSAILDKITSYYSQLIMDFKK